MRSAEDIAWFAGLFEGEGSLSRYRAKAGSGWRMCLRMTDEDVIRRIHEMYGGMVYVQKWKAKESHKNSWQWQMGTQSHIAEIINEIYPRMGSRRKAMMDLFREYFAKPIPTHSERVKKNWENPEYRERMSRERKARWATPEFRAKMAVELKRRWADPVIRAKYAADRASRKRPAI